MPNVTVRVQVEEVKAGHPITIPIYQVLVNTDTSTWEETWGSRALLDAFIRGLKAGCRMSGTILEIEPRDYA